MNFRQTSIVPRLNKWHISHGNVQLDEIKATLDKNSELMVVVDDDSEILLPSSYLRIKANYSAELDDLANYSPTCVVSIRIEYMKSKKQHNLVVFNNFNKDKKGNYVCNVVIETELDSITRLEVRIINKSSAASSLIVNEFEINKSVDVNEEQINEIIQNKTLPKKLEFKPNEVVVERYDVDTKTNYKFINDERGDVVGILVDDESFIVIQDDIGLNVEGPDTETESVYNVYVANGGTLTNQEFNQALASIDTMVATIGDIDTILEEIIS